MRVPGSGVLSANRRWSDQEKERERGGGGGGGGNWDRMIFFHSLAGVRMMSATNEFPSRVQLL